MGEAASTTFRSGNKLLLALPRISKMLFVRRYGSASLRKNRPDKYGNDGWFGGRLVSVQEGTSFPATAQEVDENVGVQKMNRHEIVNSRGS